ncbi:hypothetical protein PVK06_002185 [Gossypium arboreum]|uniref:Uncharacterized protein n=1 Tax=Gossypium arboreum TaxID=29729 RepID=A0ABR0R301_GOSAR|nr:hypothetical protein PVK06_002185 [Gossypium arboreum]
MIELRQLGNEDSTNQWSNKQGHDAIEYPYELAGKSHKILEEGYDMPEHSDKSYYDSYKISSCETTKISNSEMLSNMSDMMAQMLKTLQEISEALPLREEIVPGVPKFNHEDPCTIINHDRINGEIQ